MENEMIWNAVSPICGLFVFSASLHRGGGQTGAKSSDVVLSGMALF